MIGGWLLHNPQKTSVTISVMVCRQTHTYLNSIGAQNPVDFVDGAGNSIVASDLVASDLAFTKTTNLTLTFYPDDVSHVATGTNVRTIANVDNDATDSIRFFQFDGLAQGTTVSGVMEVDSGSGFGTRVRVSGSTLPVGSCKSATLSCIKIADNTIYPDDGDFGVALPIARKIAALNPDYISIPDDWTYNSVGGSPVGPCLFARPKLVADDYVLEPLGMDSVGYTSETLANQSYDRTSAEPNIRLVHMISCSYLSPAMQLIGHTGSMTVMPQDHDFMPNNDYTHCLVDSAGAAAWSNLFGGLNTTSHQRMLDCWSFCYRYWWSIFGSDAHGDRNPPCYGAETYSVPQQVIDDAGTYGTLYNTSDYAPRYFKVESDYCDDFAFDTFNHRSKRFDDTPSATMLGALQLSEFKAEMSASTNKYLHITSPLNMVRSVNNNTQGWVSTDPRGSSATAERKDLVDYINALGRPVSIMGGDSHFLQMTTDSNIVEFNVAPACRPDTWYRARYQESDPSTAEKWARMDDLFLDLNYNDNDASGNENYSGRHEDSACGAVVDQAIADSGDPSNETPNKSYRSGCGFGFSHFTKTKAYHMMINADGLVVGGIVEVDPI